MRERTIAGTLDIIRQEHTHWMADGHEPKWKDKQINDLLEIIDILTERRDLGGTLAPTNAQVEELRQAQEEAAQMTGGAETSAAFFARCLGDALRRIDADDRNYAILAELWSEVLHYTDGGMALNVHRDDSDDLLTRFKNAFNFQ